MRRKAGRTLRGKQVREKAAGCRVVRVGLAPGQKIAAQIRGSFVAGRDRREREPAVDDPIARGRQRARGRKLPKAVPDQPLIGENRRGVIEPHLAVDERAHGFGVPTELKQRAASHRGRFARSGGGQRGRQRREHVQSRLRPTLIDLEAREQRDDRLLLIPVAVVARFHEPAPSRERIVLANRQARRFDQVTGA